MDKPPQRLSDWPWVVVRVSCTNCPRTGRYRLARLAAKFGPECELSTVLDKIAFDCSLRPVTVLYRTYGERCGVRFTDLGAEPPKPPDVPPALRVPVLRLVRR